MLHRFVSTALLLALTSCMRGHAAVSAAAESGEGARLEAGKARPGTLDLEHDRYADFWIDVPENAVGVRFRLASKRCELTLTARRGKALDDEDDAEPDQHVETDGGIGSILFDRFSEPAVGKDRFHVRVAWTHQALPRTVDTMLTHAAFELRADVFPSRIDGVLEAGRIASGSIAPESGGFRTFRVDVPDGARALRIDITEASSDLDLFVQGGSPFLILGPTVRFAQHSYGRETLIVRADSVPKLGGGPWFVDVIDTFDEDQPADFKLLATFDTAPPAELLVLPPIPSALGPGVIGRALPAVVEITTDDATGSGSLLTKDGWILTNAHVVEALGGGPVSDVVVSLTLDLHHPARELFRGKVERYDAERDMALVKIATGFYGQPLPEGLALPTLALAPADAAAPPPPLPTLSPLSPLSIGAPLWLIGYPSTGGRGSRVTESATRGIVSGFDQAGFGPILKTDAVITSGNSGGAALDEAGRFVGIPTSTVESGSGHLGYVHPLGAMPEEWRRLLAGPAGR